MRNISIICAKELRVYFGSVAGYAIASAFLAAAGVAFFYWVNQFAASSMRPAFQLICIVLLLTVPAITMRLLAGEFASGTKDLLLVSPVAPFQVVLGKFLFCLILTLVLLVCTIHFPLLLLNYGAPDVGEMLAGYIGLLLAGAFFCSVGLFASSLTRNTPIAAVIALAVLLGLFFLPTSSGAGATAGALSPFAHFSNFAKGVLDTSDLAYFVLGTGFFLFLATGVLRLRWRA